VAAGVLLLVALAAACRTDRSATEPSGPSSPRPPRVLVFSRTAGFRHDSIPAGIAAIRRLGAEHGFAVDATEDPAAFDDARLARYAAVLFLSTTGDVLGPREERAFERYVRAGGGYVGVHAAADTEYDWEWYGELVGAYFAGHPAVQDATVRVLDHAHPSTRHLPARWVRRDEWYDYRASPTGRVHVLATLDETTYEGGSMGDDHPIAWCHEFDGGRAFYTGGGHMQESFEEPAFLEHLAGGILWAAGRVPGDAGATLRGYFDKVVLDDFVTDPMELAVAPDLRVIFVERGGVVKIWKPDTHETVIAGFVDVFLDLEDGLLGIALDPDFERTGRLYLYYSPAGDDPVNRLSRFTLEGDTLDPASEAILLEVPTQRNECCHAGGSIAFGPDGSLFLSTGDNTSPFASSGYAPIDEREGRSPFDAQKSSANTHDLRGKILRIRPEPDGTYTIPEGNLFPRDGSLGRPEIFAMGCRNPFRISVDPKRGWVWFGDVGPDASAPSKSRGPAGHDEFNLVREPGNFGWPYFIGRNLPYRRHDFGRGESGGPFDPEAPRNRSVNNTGREELPPAVPAWIAYPYAATDPAVLGSGERCAMAGPVFYRDLAGTHPNRLPDCYDGSVFLYEWSRDRIFDVKLDDRGDLLSLRRFLPGLRVERPMDLELGPDGRLYGIEWGEGFGGGNPDAQVFRLDYHPSGRRPPRAVAKASRRSGPMPLRVAFDAGASASRASDPRLRHAWDFDGDGRVDARGARATHTYRRPGDYTATLAVTDVHGLRSRATVPVSAGNTAPVVEIEWPPDGGVVELGASVDFRVRVEDAEDGAIADEHVSVQPYLGHDTHAHPLHRTTGFRGRVRTPRDAGHAGEADLFTVLAATYRDRGTRGVAPLTSRDEVVLQPRVKQAEHAGRLHGARVEKSADGASVRFEEDGASAVFDPVHLCGISAVMLRLASPGGGRVEIRADDPASGEVLGAAEIETAGSVELEAGVPLPFRVEFFERGGGAGLILRIEGPDAERQVVRARWLEGGTARVRYYALESPDGLPDFDGLEPVAEGITEALDYPSTGGVFAGSGRADDVGAVFTGAIVAPATGRYVLSLESDDGSRLLLDGREVIDLDGLHGMIERSTGWEWREVTIPLRDPGRTHALHVVFRGADAGAGPRLDRIRFEGCGVAAE